MKNKWIIVIVLGAIGLVAFPIIRLVYSHNKYGYKIELNRYKNYLGYFQDSVLKDLDTLTFSDVGKDNIHNAFHYKSNLLKEDMGYSVVIWEFQNVSNKYDIGNIYIKREKLNDVYFQGSQIIDKDSDLETEVKNGFSFKNGISVKIDVSDTILNFYRGKNYKGCFGKFDRIIFCNEKGEDQVVLYNYLESKLTSVILKKEKKRLLLFMIHSRNVFDKDIINILNI